MKFLSLALITFLFFSFSSEEKFQEPLVNLKDLSTEFVYEIRYATPNNFIGETLYDCAECLL
ncbi:MAG TPA: peptidase M15, partial [Aequorivita sp.]|nr:peptidase M15 [Aequorivita sp.]